MFSRVRISAMGHCESSFGIVRAHPNNLILLEAGSLGATSPGATWTALDGMGCEFKADSSIPETTDCRRDFQPCQQLHVENQQAGDINICFLLKTRSCFKFYRNTVQSYLFCFRFFLKFFLKCNQNCLKNAGNPRDMRRFQVSR